MTTRISDQPSIADQSLIGSFLGLSTDPDSPTGFRTGQIGRDALKSLVQDLLAITGPPQLPPNNDCNDIVETGVYITGGATVNGPGGGRIILHLERTDENRAVQLAFAASASDLLDFQIRNKHGSGIWGTFKVVFTQASIVGTVSQTGGVIDGNIIERGGTTNNAYVRWADGTQICYGLVTGIDINLSIAGTLFRSSVFSWPFPATFVDGGTGGAIVTGTVLDGSQSGLAVNSPFGGRLTGADNCRAYAISSLTDKSIFLKAHGRWY